MDKLAVALCGGWRDAGGCGAALSRDGAGHRKCESSGGARDVTGRISFECADGAAGGAGALPSAERRYARGDRRAVRRDGSRDQALEPYQRTEGAARGSFANLCGGRTRGGFAWQVEIRAERRGRRRRHGPRGCTERLERTSRKERSCAAPGEEGRDAVFDCARLRHHRDSLEELEPFSGGPAPGSGRRAYHPAVRPRNTGRIPPVHLSLNTLFAYRYGGCRADRSFSCGFFL